MDKIFSFSDQRQGEQVIDALNHPFILSLGSQIDYCLVAYLGLSFGLASTRTSIL